MWLCRVLRPFGQVAVPASPKVKALLKQLNNTQARRIDLFPTAAEQFAALQDLNLPLLNQLRYFTTDQLILTLRSYALSGEGSEELYQTALEQVERRLRTLTGEQMAALCYYLEIANVTDKRLIDTAERTFLQNGSVFSPTAVAQLTFALSNCGSEAFFAAALSVFKANSTAFTAENGLLLLSGLLHKGKKDASLGPSLISWTKTIKSSQSVLVEIHHLLLQLQTSEIAINSLDKQFQVLEMNLRTAQLLLESCVTYHRPGIEELIGHIGDLMGRTDVDVTAVARLIYTAKKVPDKAEIGRYIHKFIQRNLVLFTPREVSLIASALLATKDTNEATFTAIADMLVTIKLPTEDLLRLLLTSGSDFNPLFASLSTQIIESLNGHIFQPSEFVLLISLLARGNAANEDLWSAAMREAKSISLEDAEQYMQLYSALKTVKGVQTAETLKTLEERYEGGQSS